MGRGSVRYLQAQSSQRLPIVSRHRLWVSRSSPPFFFTFAGFFFISPSSSSSHRTRQLVKKRKCDRKYGKSHVGLVGSLGLYFQISCLTLNIVMHKIGFLCLFRDAKKDNAYSRVVRCENMCTTKRDYNFLGHRN